MHVVAAAIIAGSTDVLIAQRPDHLHQGGLWEFPGGKVEAGEAVASALARELEEELGITPRQARPLIRIPHRYPDRSILLDVWRVDAFDGCPHGREGQAVRWVAIDALRQFPFPPPNYPIISALQLPERYLITPDPGAPSNWPHFLQQLENCLKSGEKLVQLRAKQRSTDELMRLAEACLMLCRRYGARLLLNAEPAVAESLGVDGVQLSSRALQRCSQRPVNHDLWLGASCHSAEELEHACSIGVDFALLSPVRPTTSHPGSPALGWERFAQLAEMSTVPVYALGGMAAADIALAQHYGGQGIAAISGLWDICTTGGARGD